MDISQICFLSPDSFRLVYPGAQEIVPFRCLKAPEICSIRWNVFSCSCIFLSVMTIIKIQFGTSPRHSGVFLVFFLSFLHLYTQSRRSFSSGDSVEQFLNMGMIISCFPIVIASIVTGIFVSLGLSLSVCLSLTHLHTYVHIFALPFLCHRLTCSLHKSLFWLIPSSVSLFTWMTSCLSMPCKVHHHVPQALSPASSLSSVLSNCLQFLTAPNRFSFNACANVRVFFQKCSTAVLIFMANAHISRHLMVICYLLYTTFYDLLLLQVDLVLFLYQILCIYQCTSNIYFFLFLIICIYILF